MSIRTCQNCGNEFHHHNSDEFLDGPNNKKNVGKFCSKVCHTAYRNKNTSKIEYSCTYCGKPFLRLPADTKNSKNVFCSQSCGGYYNNARRSGSSRRSKLEKWLEAKLLELYPTLEIQYNKRNIVSYELDIYIPSLKLAFELNGIFHYEPIYGNETLQNIQARDSNKFMNCQKAGISLCVIDTSSFRYFKEEKAGKYLKIVTDIIDEIKEKNVPATTS